MRSSVEWRRFDIARVQWRLGALGFADIEIRAFPVTTSRNWYPVVLARHGGLEGYR
jgi:hypothetical protein